MSYRTMEESSVQQVPRILTQASPGQLCAVYGYPLLGNSHPECMTGYFQ